MLDVHWVDSKKNSNLHLTWPEELSCLVLRIHLRCWCDGLTASWFIFLIHYKWFVHVVNYYKVVFTSTQSLSSWLFVFVVPDRAFWTCWSEIQQLSYGARKHFQIHQPVFGASESGSSSRSSPASSLSESISMIITSGSHCAQMCSGMYFRVAITCTLVRKMSYWWQAHR